MRGTSQCSGWNGSRSAGGSTAVSAPLLAALALVSCGCEFKSATEAAGDAAERAERGLSIVLERDEVPPGEAILGRVAGCRRLEELTLAAVDGHDRVLWWKTFWPKRTVISFACRLRRPAADNQLRLLAWEGTGRRASTSFHVTRPLFPWDDYRIRDFDSARPPLQSMAGYAPISRLAAVALDPNVIPLFSLRADSAARDLWACVFAGDEGAVLPKPGGRSRAVRLKPETSKVLASLASGLGKLLLASEPQDEGVAVFFSPLGDLSAKDAGAKASGSPDLANPRIPPAVTAWTRLLDAENVQYRLVSNSSVQEGSLESGRFRLLILPEVFRMSSAGAAAVLRFTRARGVVAADRLPGVLDGYGAARDSGLLNSLFGVRCPAPESVLDVPRNAFVTFEDKGESLVRGVPGGVLPLGSTGLTASGALSAGRAENEQAVFINRQARGRAVCFNVDIAAAVGARATAALPDDSIRKKRFDAARALVRNLLALYPVRPWEKSRKVSRVTVVEDGGRADDIRVTLRRPGDMEIAAIEDLRPPDAQPRTVRVTLPATLHIYDTLRGHYLGRSKSVALELSPDRPLLLSLFPHDIEELSLRLWPIRGDGFGYRVTAISTGRQRTLHVFHVDVTAPSGEKLDWYSLNVAAGSGVYDGTFLPAANGPAGKYRLMVTDVATGQKVEAVLTKARSDLAKDLLPRLIRPRVRVRVVQSVRSTGGKWKISLEFRSVAAGRMPLGRVRLLDSDGNELWNGVLSEYVTAGLDRSPKDGVVLPVVEFADGWKQPCGRIVAAAWSPE